MSEENGMPVRRDYSITADQEAAEHLYQTTYEQALASLSDPDRPVVPERIVLAERKRCLAIAFEVLQHGPGFDASKEFADGYSLAAQEIAAAIQRSK